MLVSTGIVTPQDSRPSDLLAIPQILAGNDALAERDDPPAQVLEGGNIAEWPMSHKSLNQQTGEETTVEGEPDSSASR